MRNFAEGDTKVLTTRGIPPLVSEPFVLPSIHTVTPHFGHLSPGKDASFATNALKHRSSLSGSGTGSFQVQWLFFSNQRWIPLDVQNHARLERTLQLGGVFVDIQDSHFPNVQRIRVFPGGDYLSYLGVRYRISRVLLPPL